MGFKNGLTFYLKDGTPVHPFMIRKVYSPQTGEPTGYYSTLYNDEGITVLFKGNLASCPDIANGGTRTIEFANGYKLVISKVNNDNYGPQIIAEGYDAEDNSIYYSGFAFVKDPVKTIVVGVWQYADNGVYDVEGDYTLKFRQVYDDWFNGTVEFTPPGTTTLEALTSEWAAPNLLNPLGFPSNYSVVSYDNGYDDYNSDPLIVKKQSFWNFYNNATTRPDPNEQGGISGGGGGGGNFDNSSDVISFPTLPEINAITAGLVSIYSPTISQITNFSRFLWSDSFTSAVVKNFTQPIENIINFGILPLSLPTTIDTNVKIGGISAGISMDKVNSQFIVFDCGTIDVSEYWGNCMDYAPHTKISIYCPFSGIQSISVDDIMGNTISLKYYIDVLTGSFNAMLASGDHVLYSWSGNMMLNCPISMSNWFNTYTGVVESGLSLISGGTSAVMNPVSALSGIMSTATNVMNSKPTIGRTGGMNSASGFLGIRTPYIIIERPRQSLAKDYATFRGYPSNITETLGNLKGYTEVESIHLENISATSAEYDEIISLLNGGVIL